MLMSQNRGGGKNGRTSPHPRPPERQGAIEQLEPRTLLSSASFLSPVSTGITDAGAAVATASGDVNGDGIPDLVVNSTLGTSQVFLGTASGAFQRGASYGGSGRLAALGDFNGDGKLDLATASGIRLGNGDGTFGTTLAEFTQLTNTFAIFTGDFNGDGKLDLAAETFVAGGTSSTVGISILLGNGAGNLAAPISTTAGTATGIGSNYSTFVTGDFNGDGKLDVASPFGVLLGNGSGGFTAPTAALPISSLPTTPAITAGDFNGDGKLDLAVVTTAGTSATSAGQVEILFGKGDGTFTDAGTVSFGSTGGIGTLTALDVSGDGIPDLIAGTGAAGGNSSVAVALGTGSGTFGTPTFVATGGPPVAIYTGDFNADKAADILAIDAAPGTVFSGVATPDATAAAVLINTTIGTLTPTVALTTSSNPAIAGVAVQFTATVVGPTATSATPAGTVTFSDGSTILGTATLNSAGKATFSTTSLGAGPHSITATYAGDADYLSAVSPVLSQSVLITPAKVPVLVAGISLVSLPSPFIAGDKASVLVTVNNAGGGAANGTVNLLVYATTTGTIDANSIAIPIKSLRNVGIHIGSGGIRTFTGNFTATNLPAGSYKLAAMIVPVKGFTADQVSSTIALSTSSFQSLGNVFGTVGTHKNVTFTVTDSAGKKATLSLSGPGQGTVTQTVSGTDVTVTGTTAASVLHLTSKGARFSFDDVTVNGSLSKLDGKTIAVNGALTVTGNVRTLALAAAGIAGSSGTTISLGAGAAVALTVGDMEAVTLNSAAAISTLSATTWQSGTISAPSIATLTVKKALSANVYTHTTTRLGTATIGTITGGTWAIRGNIGTLKVNGLLSQAQVFDGIDAGADNTLGTSDDVYSAAVISTVLVNGAVSSSTIAAGAAPASGGVFANGLVLLPKGGIRAITVKGTVSADSRFLALELPAKASIAGVKVVTATDPRFHV